MDRRDFLKSGVALSGALIAPAAGLRRRLGSASQGSPVAGGRDRLLFDFGWLFAFGHATDLARDFRFGLGDEFKQAGAVMLSTDYLGFRFDDSQWRPVDLPHDWALELPFERHDARWLYGSKPVGWPFPATSVGWYRRTFEVRAADQGRRITLVFDGIFRDSIVTLNGYLLGRHASGYTSQQYDISDYLNFGGRNTIAVRVDASQSEGWWNEGAGIYRHAWLSKTHPVHIDPDGLVIRSSVESGRALVDIAVEVVNESDREAIVRLGTTVVDGSGAPVALAQREPTPISAWSRDSFAHRVVIDHAALWSPETPSLYRVEHRVEADGVEVDQYQTRFGIKTAVFDPDRGFLLNGQPYQIRGTCNHQDFAGVGVAVPDAIHRYRIQRLKSMGSNAYRAHHPSTAELLDACDELGMLVLAETRAGWAAPEALAQLEWMVRRDRNRACLLGWSLGNQEIYGGTKRGDRILASMRRAVRRLDPEHPVTLPQTNQWGENDPTVVDVQGMQYPKAEQIDAFHQKFPKMPILGTEVASTSSTRGIYLEDKENAYVSTFAAYLSNRPGWGSTPGRWMSIFAERPYLAGAFVWAGFDYRGEPNPYKWPGISTHYGVFDTCGIPKDHYYFYRAWWTDYPVLHLFPHWNWPGREGEVIDVFCYTNMDRVELLHNGRSLGAKEVARFGHLVWQVAYRPGTLEARGYRNRRRVMVARRETTGPAARIELAADRSRLAADGEDVALVEFRILDANNRVVPTADNEVSFSLSGPGRIIGVGNGNPSSHESDQASKRKAFNGLGLALVQVAREVGDLIFVAESPGLRSASVTLRLAPGKPRPAVS